MGSSSTELLSQIYEVLAASGEVHQLHGDPIMQDRERETTDLDLMCAGSPVELVLRALDDIQKRDVHLIWIWWSDVGTLNTFWRDAVTEAYAQVDVLADDAGGNRFGFRTSKAFEVLREAAQCGSTAEVKASLEADYLLAKRLSKGQLEFFERRQALREFSYPHCFAWRTRAALRMVRTRRSLAMYGSLTKLRSRLIRLPRYGSAQGRTVTVDPSVVMHHLVSLQHFLPRVRASSRPVAAALYAWAMPALVLVPKPGASTQIPYAALSTHARRQLSGAKS
jgi:hypothetical protein